MLRNVTNISRLNLNQLSDFVTFWIWVVSNQCLTNLKLQRLKKIAQIEDSPGNNDTSRNRGSLLEAEELFQAAKDWSWTRDTSRSPLCPSPTSSSFSLLPQWERQQMTPAKCLPRRRECVVCLSLWSCASFVSVCPFTLTATLAVMCLIEDKQHPLRRVFTAKHFPHNITTLRAVEGILYPRLHLWTFTTCTRATIHSHMEYERFGSSYSKLPLSPLPQSRLLSSRTVGRWVAEMSFNYRRTLERNCSFGPICWKLPTVIFFSLKYVQFTLTLTHTSEVVCRKEKGELNRRHLGRKKEEESLTAGCPGNLFVPILRRAFWWGLEGWAFWFIRCNVAYSDKQGIEEKRQEWWRTLKVRVLLIKNRVQHANCFHVSLKAQNDKLGVSEMKTNSVFLSGDVLPDRCNWSSLQQEENNRCLKTLRAF